MTRKEYEDAIAVNCAVMEAVLNVYLSTDDENRNSLMLDYFLAIGKKRDEIETQWEQEINLPRLMEIVKISGLSCNEFSKKYGVSLEALIGEEAVDDISSLEKAVYEDKAKAHLKKGNTQMKDAIANKMQELKEKYPCVTYEGNTYYPIEAALFDIDSSGDPYYWARAIKESAHRPDEWDCIHLYVIRWILKDKYYDYWKCRWEEREYDAYDVDESDMCDWDSPYDVVDNDDYKSVDDILKIQI